MLSLIQIQEYDMYVRRNRGITLQLFSVSITITLSLKIGLYQGKQGKKKNQTVSENQEGEEGEVR